MLYENKNNFDNITKKYSDLLSYYFGNSFLFSREKIHYMKLLYLDYPIFYPELERVSWDQYLLLFKIGNKKERYFYYRLSLWFNSNYEDTYQMIKNNYYNRLLSFDI